MTIELVTMFRCPETGKLFKTERGAENSAKRTRDDKELSLLATGFDPSGFEAQQDYVRLNATNPMSIIDLVREKAEEFWGLKITRFEVNKAFVTPGKEISFGQCHIEVNSAGSCRLAYMVQKAKVEKDKWYREPSISDLLFGSMGFRGFETGSGCPGRCGDYPFRMSPLTARLEEFPLINERYRDWTTHKGEYDRYVREKRMAEGYGYWLARSSTEYEKLEELRAYHRNCDEIVKESISKLESYYVEGLVQKWEAINPPVERDTELWDMFGVGG